MKDIPEFKIDKWIQLNEPTTRISIHGSNVSALSLRQLQQLAGDDDLPGPIDLDVQLTYGIARGSLRLRERIAELHSSKDIKFSADNVVITPGSIMANYLTLTSLCGAGDHVICQYPTFSQLFVIPRFQGAEISLWKMRAADNWMPRLEDLEAMIKPNTKLIIINNPNNPTGAVLPTPLLTSLIALAAPHHITILSDEVFAPLFHAYPPDPTPAPFVSLGYPHSASTGSLSKAFGLPGLRVGWLVSANAALLARVMAARDYTTIAVSQLDDGVAAFALGKAVYPRLLGRSLALCREGLGVLEGFLARNLGRVECVVPGGAGTAFVRILGPGGAPVDDVVFARRLVAERGVSVVPGSECFADGEDGELRGYVRVTIGEPEKLKEGLSVLEEALAGLEA